MKSYVPVSLAGPVLIAISLSLPMILSGEPEVGDPDVTPDLDERHEKAMDEVSSRPADPAEAEKVRVRSAGHDERQAERERVHPDCIDQCHQFVDQVLHENQRVREKEGLIDPDFELEVDGFINPYAVISLMKMPGETLDLKVHRGDGLFVFDGVVGEVEPGDGGTTWKWKLPENPGIYCGILTDRAKGTSMLVHAMVCVPYSGEKEIESFKIGSYQDKPLRGNPRYERPEGFVRVTSENADTWLTPHLQLRQFLCKQSSSFPAYALVETRLLLKLEALIERLKGKGIPADSLYITSAFRTPHYNRALGNTTDYSRHLYGDAADIFIDTDDDYRLDDLNGDGKETNSDARYLSKVIEEVSSELPDFFRGGLGFYGFKSSRTAFIHTDTRGYEARWGFGE